MFLKSPGDLSSGADPGPWHALNVGVRVDQLSTGDTLGEGGSEARSEVRRASMLVG
jgi:hypothetical protein